MRERPILFSGPMVRALLAGTKTQTRRIMKPQPQPGRYGATHPTNPHGLIGHVTDGHGGADYHVWEGPRATAPLTSSAVYVALNQCPYGQPGDRLWVREAWGIAGGMRHDPGYAAYRADCQGNFDDVGNFIPKWRPSIHMPRWASRITLEITGVRVERLQEISEADAIAEGIDDVTAEVAPSDPEFRFWRRYRDGGWNGYTDNAIASYASLWTEINGQGSWEANPWVWVVEFRVLAHPDHKDGGANAG